MPRRRRRTPLSRVAPTITGRATVRERRLACWRVNVANERRRGWRRCATPWSQRGGLGQTEYEAVGGGGVAGPAILRTAIGDRHRDRPGNQAHGGGAGAAKAPLDLTLEPVADDRRRHEGESDHRRAPGVEQPELLRDHAALAHQQGAGRPRVERHLEALAGLGVELVPLPAGQPGQQREVSRAGDREQLGRPLNRPQRDRAGGAQAGGVGSHSALPRRRLMSR